MIAGPWSGRFRAVYVCYMFYAKRFILNQGFNNNDLDFGELVLRATCTITSRLSMTTTRSDLAVLVVVGWFKDLNVNFIIFRVYL
jgi:hypothetical protein